MSKDPVNPISFPEEFVTEVRQSIKQAFELFPLRWVKLTFQPFAWYHISTHFTNYAIVTEKLKLEAMLKQIEADLSQIQRELRLVLKTGEKLQKRYEKFTQGLRDDIQQLETSLARSQKSPENIRVELREKRIEEWYHTKLKEYPIKPAVIPGIGPTRVSALDYADIRTAADITPSNADKGRLALSRVRGATPSSEWRDLENWREKLRQRLPRPLIKEPSQEEIQSIYSEHEAKRTRLSHTIKEKKRILEDTRLSPDPVGQEIIENSKVESEINAKIKGLEEQLLSLKTDLKAYKLITPEKLLEAVLNE